ncbi:probable ADP-ribosylation factor GTPase-activating protein AGD14 isoform X2 [Cynara cardunculus var. scolymus]|uniref:probable ADP-ribosylation factor GTPase-activating protein AGD14 isoform X2 n=1 Tax=Cynara cardunculus var. scolymus TaxID=59895 RepID=UPI000D629F1B|nr:probable ADP-ribosylation factor GTPase-activating protein AGD14 isoform X2 [Cynara cardunculus var. scolymus]
MTSRLKEDEKNERSIRNLLKLPQNRRCINCNSLGPQYVCTNFWTFVCTTCSGIHREFTHRVKSVSMAKFTSQEVSALQGGGNASAREIYFKEWDAARQSFPDSSNVERLRDFIKLVYVNRRYTGEKSFDKPPRVKTGEAEDSYQGGSRSPPFENERRYSERSTPGGKSGDRSFKDSYNERRSPGYDQDFSRSPPAACTETINDWRREDIFRDGRRAEDGKFPDGGGSKVEGKSPDHQRDPDMSSPPIVRPVRDMGEKVSPLRVIEPPKVDGPKPSDGSSRTQRTVSSSGLASSNGNPAELRTESSLIDFDAVPEPTSTVPVPQIQQSASSPALFAPQPTTSSNNNWANFDSVQEVKAPHAPTNTNLLDVLSELSVPSSLPGGVGASLATPGGSSFPSNATPQAAPPGHVQWSSFGTSAPVAAPISHSTVAPGGAQAATPGPNAFFNTADGGWWQNVHPQQNRLPVTGNQAPVQSFNQAVGGSQNNQPWNPSLSGNSQGAQSQVTHGVDVKPTTKKELPVDLFTSNYSSFAAPNPGWFPAPQYGMGFNMHYNVPAPMPPAFLQPSSPSIPFDVNESSPAQATTFPSMAPLQGALPPSVGIYRTSSLGTHPPAWMPTQSFPLSIQRTSSLGTPSQASHHQLPMPTQVPSYGSPMPSGLLMGTAAPRPQVDGGFGLGNNSFGTLNVGQQQSGSSFSPNPFG